MEQHTETIARLRAENEQLQAENQRLREILAAYDDAARETPPGARRLRNEIAQLRARLLRWPRDWKAKLDEAGDTINRLRRRAPEEDRHASMAHRSAEHAVVMTVTQVEDVMLRGLKRIDRAIAHLTRTVPSETDARRAKIGALAENGAMER